MISDEYNRWRDLIGDFILEFAKAEVDVFGIFEDFGSDEEMQKARDTMFKQRACKAITLVNSIENEEKIRRPVINSLNELIKLADNVRNLIAHNPLEMSLEAALSGTDDHEIRSFRNFEKVITYNDLKKYYQELVDWRGILHTATFQMRTKQSWLKSQP